MIQLACAGGLGLCINAKIRLDSPALQNAMMFFIILAVALLAGVLLDRRYVRDFGFRLDRRWLLNLCGGLLLGALMATCVFVFEYSQGWIDVKWSRQTPSTLISSLLIWLFAATIAATAEETVFRGYQLKNISEGLGRLGAVTSFVVAAIISSVAFGLIHGVNPNSGAFAVISILMAGIMFCVGRLYTGSLAAPIGLHLAWNYCLAIVFGLPVSGQKMEGTLLESKFVIHSVWTGGDFGPEASPLVIACMGFAVLAFLCWPDRRDWDASCIEMVTFIKRTPR